MKSINDMNAILMSGVESAAQMSIGQAVLKLVDRILWIIEKSVQWSLPTPEITADSSTTEENGKSFGKVELVRPLPWIVFLPGLLLLRMVRFSLNTGACILGYPEVQPADMIRVIQRGRRRIRAIKSSGLKSMRQKKNPQTTLQKDLPIMHRKLENEATLLKNLSKVERKRNYSELSSDASDDDSDDENLINKLNRLANESGSDRDFSPAECASSETSVTSESEADVSIPLSEVQELNSEIVKVDKLPSHIKPEDANTKCDDELHKLRNHLKFEIPNGPEKSMTNNLIEEAVSKVETNNENEQIHTGLSNGVANDVDTIYFSPISWKSVSPELSVSPDKQDNQINNEETPGELSNGEVDGNEIKDNENDNPCIDVGKEVTNGHMKEKQSTVPQNINSNKHHQQKSKRGNHGNRKKK